MEAGDFLDEVKIHIGQIHFSYLAILSGLQQNMGEIISTKTRNFHMLSLKNHTSATLTSRGGVVYSCTHTHMFQGGMTFK